MEIINYKKNKKFLRIFTIEWTESIYFSALNLRSIIYGLTIDHIVIKNSFVSKIFYCLCYEINSIIIFINYNN